MAKKTILVSAGHSTVPPKDPGATGNGYVEAEVALMMRDKVANILAAQNYTVLTDGTVNVNQPLNEAVKLARQANIAIEFHLNAASPQATGVEILAKPNNKRLAMEIGKAINKATGLKMRGEFGFKPDNSGQHHRLAFCEAGGLIVELAFISNPNDMKALMTNFDAVAEGIATVLRLSA